MDSQVDSQPLMNNKPSLKITSATPSLLSCLEHNRLSLQSSRKLTNSRFDRAQQKTSKQNGCNNDSIRNGHKSDRSKAKCSRKVARCSATDQSSKSVANSSALKAAKAKKFGVDNSTLTAAKANSILTPQPKHGGRRASITFTEVPELRMFDKGRSDSLVAPVPTVTSKDKAAVKSKSKSPLSTHRKHRTPHPKSTCAPFWEDQLLSTSKIYFTRHYRSACHIQRMIRGFLQRRAFLIALPQYRAEQERRRQHTIKVNAARCIQHSIRAFLHKRHVCRTRLATLLQALSRGHLARLQFRIKLLERQLARIDLKKSIDLTRIELWKREQIASMQKLMDADLDQFCRQNAQACLNMDMIKALRKSNRKRRAEQEQLRRDIQEVQEANEALTVEAIAQAQCAPIVRQVLQQVQCDNFQWQEIHDRFEARVREYKIVVEEREMYGKFERSMKRLYESTLKRIKRQIEICCNDSASSYGGDYGSDSESEFGVDSDLPYEGDAMETYLLLQQQGLFDNLQSVPEYRSNRINSIFLSMRI